MKKDIPTPHEVMTNAELKKQAAIEEFNRLSERQKGLLTILMNNPGISKPEACRQAGYKVTKNARVSGIFRTLQGKLGDSFKRYAGVSELDLVLTFTECLYAEKKVPIMIPEFDEEGKRIGTKVELISIGADYITRLNAAKFIAKIGNYEPALSFNVNDNSKSDNIIINIGNLNNLKDLNEVRENVVKIEEEINADFSVEDDEEGSGIMDRESQSCG